MYNKLVKILENIIDHDPVAVQESYKQIMDEKLNIAISNRKEEFLNNINSVTSSS